jgi:hypothetical protein
MGWNRRKCRKKKHLFALLLLTHLECCDDKFDVDNYQSAVVSFTKRTSKDAIEDVQVVTLHRLHNICCYVCVITYSLTSAIQPAYYRIDHHFFRYGRP